MSQARAIVADSSVVLAPDGRPAFLHAIENNWYEASRYSPARSFIWHPVQDATRDLDRFTRQELSKHARYLYKNSPLIRGLIERMVTLVIGSGFHPVFKSSNPEWNERAKNLMKKRFRNVHLGARCSFYQYQRAIARARFLDGSCFSVLTSDETVDYRAKVQGLEADRICGTRTGAGDTREFGATGIVDGQNLNHQGIVLSYNIAGVSRPYMATEVVHHFTPNRLGQYWGEPVLAAAINTARDVDDILALEKQCVKDASSKQDIIKTASGTLDSETFRSMRFSAAGSGQPFSLPTDNNTKSDYYRVRFGAEPIVLKQGDEYTPYKPDRPGAAWQGFMDFLSQTICLSSGFPPSVILPVNIGGTDVRRDLDVAQKVADPLQADIAAELDDIVTYLVEGEIQDGELRKDLPDDWQAISWHFPCKVNVDRSQAQQDREDVAHGLMSLEEYHARYSTDAGEVEKTIIAGAKRRKEAIKAAGFADVAEFVQVLSLSQNMQGQKPAMPPGGKPNAPAA